MSGHCFISYTNAKTEQTAVQLALKLADKLKGEPPHIDVWIDNRSIHAGNWDEQVSEAIKTCKCLLFIASPDSVTPNSICADEVDWALKYKKTIIPLIADQNTEVPFRLSRRKFVDFTGDFEIALSQLRNLINWLDTPEGELHKLQDRLADANRDLRRNPENTARIEKEIEELKAQIQIQERVAANPQAAADQTQKNIETGLERERKPQLPAASFQSSKFINQPPGVAQTYFQDRTLETEQAILFLKNEAQRVLTVVGRGGAGKTAMVCRLLKFVENGGLPDDFEHKHGRVDVDGIVYLSEAGSRKVNFANLFEDLCKLLPAASAEKLSALYREPQTSTESKTVQLLAAFQGLKQVIVLLDNFENVVDAEKGQVRDAELDEALRAFLHAPHHPVKIIITTRVSARELDTFEPARQRLLPLDTGLQPEYAREAFVLMDEGNLVGIKNAGADLLNLAVTRTLGLPRALEALYAALRTDRFTTLQELLDLPILPEQVVQAYVGEAFNRLDTNAQKVMQALAVYNRPVTPAAVDYLLAPHIPAIDSAPILQRLANMHFARKESGRFYLHPVDREFAYNLLPEGSSDDTVIEKGGLKLFKSLWDLLDKYPDLLRNQDTFNQAVQNENTNIVIGSVMAFQKLDASLVEKMQQEGIFQDENFLAELDKSFHIPPIWSRYALNNRAADYFAQARKPRAEWKKLDDLAAQLAEFELRCEAGDYDTAANILREIDYDYLDLWGHYRFLLMLRLQLTNKLHDETNLYNILGLARILYKFGQSNDSKTWYEQGLNDSQGDDWKYVFLEGLGDVNSSTGKISSAISFYEQALSIAKKFVYSRSEARILDKLGSTHTTLGETNKAMEYCKQALKTVQDIGEQGDASTYFDNYGLALLDLKDYVKAKESFLKAVQIADDMTNPYIQNYAREGLAQVYLFQNDLVNARATIEAALNYDEPQNNHNASALHGIIALRQGDEVAARGAFVRAIGQADEILSKTAEYYSALDAKGLALCGLILCRGGRPSAPTDGPIPTVNDAIETFRKARKIAPHAGVVKSVLRLFDELMKCEGGEILKDVREAIAPTVTS